VVEKSLRRLTLYNQGIPVKTYYVALGGNPVGDKKYQGDRRTPEGIYRIEARNPQSKFHLALRVSYPSSQDIAEARSLGRPAGGDIMIHGLPRGYEWVGAKHRQDDWTNGCIAVTNEEIEEIYRAVRLGATIVIRP
jgi:murein L,D-transpeptidase YafK